MYNNILVTINSMIYDIYHNADILNITEVFIHTVLTFSQNRFIFRMIQFYLYSI